jgi:hypothetical protein
VFVFVFSSVSHAKRAWLRRQVPRFKDPVSVAPPPNVYVASSTLRGASPPGVKVQTRPPTRAFPFGATAGPSSVPSRQENVGYVETPEGQLIKGTRADG